VILRILAQESPDLELRLKSYEGLKSGAKSVFSLEFLELFL
jgi:hypothetical protein